MRRALLFFTLLSLFGTTVAYADVQDDAPEALLERLDYYHHFDRHEDVLDLLDRQSPVIRSVRGELLWRRARALVATVDLGTWEGSIERSRGIAMLEEAESYARDAMNLLPDRAEPYFWVAAAMGKRGELRGVLNSLFMASDIRDYAADALERDEEQAEVYYLLTQVYRQLPRWPVSFGNNDYAVSLARRSVALYEAIQDAGEAPVQYYDHYTQLAHALWERNSNVRQRNRWVDRAASDFEAAGSALERGFYFEGTLEIPQKTDRDEARAILDRVIRELSAIPDPRLRYRMDLAEARELRDSW